MPLAIGAAQAVVAGAVTAYNAHQGGASAGDVAKVFGIAVGIGLAATIVTMIVWNFIQPYWNQYISPLFADQSPGAEVVGEQSGTDAATTKAATQGAGVAPSSSGASGAAVDTTPVWPTDHAEITRGFTTGEVHPVTGELVPHTAIDVVNPHGGNVYSVLDGTVTEVGNSSAAGDYIKISHAGGYESSYSHTRSLVRVGNNVTRGQQIGVSNSSGRITGPHLHFVLRHNGVRINPMIEFFRMTPRP